MIFTVSTYKEQKDVSRIEVLFLLGKTCDTQESFNDQYEFAIGFPIKSRSFYSWSEHKSYFSRQAVSSFSQIFVVFTSNQYLDNDPYG